MANAQTQHESCSILFIGQDQEWIHAYLKLAKQIYMIRDFVADTEWKIPSLLQEETPDLIFLLAGQEGINIGSVRNVLTNHKIHVPVIYIDTQNKRPDELVKQGCDFVIPRVELHTAVKYTQNLVRYELKAHKIEEQSKKQESISTLYDSLYKDLPDPICYIQDGLFMDANPAFLSTFGLKSLDELLDVTLMNLVAPRSEKELKALLRTVVTKGVAPSEAVVMQTLAGEKKEFICSASKLKYHDVPAVQLYLRDAKGGAGGGSTSDATTGLPGLSVLSQSIEAQKQAGKGSLGYWALLWAENYREVWQKDGFDKAEILIKFIAEGVQRLLPTSAITARYVDDMLVVWLQGEYDTVYERIEHLVEQLTNAVPEGIGRLIHPSLYVGLETIGSDYTINRLLSTSFRGCKALSLAQSSERIAESGTGALSRKDERKVAGLQRILDEGRLHVRYQPISSLEPDGVPRFAARYFLEMKEDDEDIELESLMALAERYQYARRLDELKITHFLQAILSSNIDQKAIRLYISLSIQSLSDSDFAEWVLSQFKQTGISVKQAVFEISLDAANTAFSGAQKFMKEIRQAGGQIALTEIARVDDEIRELFSRFKPEILKLDMREIDTFEDEEEDRFMTAIKEYDAEHHVMIIVDHMESPAQLSRVWPHDLKYLQGDGLLPPMDNFEFDFNEPLF